MTGVLDALKSRGGIHTKAVVSNVQQGIIVVRADPEPALAEVAVRSLLTEYGFSLRSMKTAPSSEWQRLTQEYQ